MFDLVTKVIDDIPDDECRNKSVLIRALLENYCAKAQPDLWDQLSNQEQYLG